MKLLPGVIYSSLGFVSAIILGQAILAWTNPIGSPLSGGGAISFLNGNVGIGTTNPGTKLEVAGSLTITGSASYLKLPSLTATQRDAISAGTGMVIYNTTANEAQVYALSGWKKLGVTLASAGTACGSNSQCATGYCVDGYCCDTAVRGQRLSDLRPLIFGRNRQVRLCDWFDKRSGQ
jgi:hypothetical protein